jgi:DNA-directed RNA polymerase specialized sigma24 family protein
MSRWDARMVNDGWIQALREGTTDSPEPTSLTDEIPARALTDLGPEQLAMDTNSATRLAALLDTLPERQREVLILRVEHRRENGRGA